jgi:HAD superfamily hydrolase (TIGR01509 family)
MAERRALEAVVFDAGGTLVRIDFEWISEMLAGLGVAIAPAALRRGEVEGRRAYDSSSGTRPRPDEPAPPLGSSGDTRAYLGGTLIAAGVPAAHLEEALARMAERHQASGLWTRPMEGARDALDALATMGVRRAVVSNSDGRAERHLDDCGVREGLEFVVDSQIVGFEKPDPRIFGVALDRLGVVPERALYVGDIRSVDESGARAAGMHFVLIDPYGDYASPGTSSIPGPAALPSWIADHFTPVRAPVHPSSPHHP